MFFDARFVDDLKKKTIAVQQYCRILNADAALIEKLNKFLDPAVGETNFKSERFFISDLITLCEKGSAKQIEKANFTLAYYYDVLRNGKFADEREIAVLNNLVSTDSFKAHLQKIKHDNKLPLLAQFRERPVLPQALAGSKQHADVIALYKEFLSLAFDQSSDEYSAAFQNTADAAIVQNSAVTFPPENDSLEKVLEELHSLIGLENIKKNVEELVNFLHIQKKRTSEGLKNVEITLHAVFLGPPGTGKTTVARLVGRIYKHLEYLSKGQIYETDREGMVAGYVGQTATKVNKVIDESIGGVLFIDEAYALTQNQGGSDYGAESISILLKRMEDYRDDLAVIVAGYEEPMKEFVESNPGLRSRFNRFFYFENFTPAQLYQIFESICTKSDFIIDGDAAEKLNDTFSLLYEKRDEGFGNARTVRNLFERCVQLQANRIIKLPQLSQPVLKTFTEEDIPEPQDTLKQVFFSTAEPPK
jgi:hypothetical protein